MIPNLHALTPNAPSNATEVRRVHGFTWSRDLRNIASLLAGFLVVLLVISPQHDFPITDDWAYAQSVRDLLAGALHPHEWTQALGLTHVLWGSLFVLLFGFSFTTLTLSILALSAVTLVTFYVLLRKLRLRPHTSLFGAAVLGFNPLFFHLSYTYMTDVTFLACLMLAALCFVCALDTTHAAWDGLVVMRMEGRGNSQSWRGIDARWLVACSIFIALSYLTRQFGALFLVAAIAYLLWARRLTWRAALALAAIPVVSIVSYMVWERQFPVPLINFYQVVVDTQESLANPLRYLAEQSLLLSWVLTTPSLCLLPLVWRPRRVLLVIPFLLVLMAFQIYTTRYYGTMFPRYGSLVDVGGFNMLDYTVAPILNQGIWLIAGVVAALVLAFYLAACAERTYGWARSAASRREVEPDAMLYILAFLMTCVVFLLPTGLFDRYMLPVVVILMIPALRHIDAPPGRPPLDEAPVPSRNVMRDLAWRWALLLLLALFSLVGQRDYMDHATVRWGAAESLVAQGVEPRYIEAGYEWAGWHLLERGVEIIRATYPQPYRRLPLPSNLIADPRYLISDLPRAGYTEVESFPYRSWLDLGQERLVLVLKRDTR
ncbi:MAG TPA: glycosyltransferase family 39 protein [Chloroflexia bacterium]